MSPAQRKDFFAFTTRFSGRARQIITDVVVLPGFDPASPPNPPPQQCKTRALWDTGASGSVISPTVAQQLGLVPVGSMQIAHAGGAGQSPTYLVNLLLPNQVGIPGIIVSEFQSIGGPFEVLIGMDVISHGDLAVTNVNGKTCVSFRIPSCAEHDYVAEANRIKYAGVGRNDRCPCGSGRKFKACHGSTGPSPRAS